MKVYEIEETESLLRCDNCGAVFVLDKEFYDKYKEVIDAMPNKPLTNTSFGRIVECCDKPRTLWVTFS